MSEEEEYNNQVGGMNIPESFLELQYITTAPTWGREAPTELWDKLKISQITYDDKGNPEMDQKTKQSAWGLLGFFTQDIRLGNLNFLEVEYAREWIEIAGDLLECDYIGAFNPALRRPIGVLELSQSKGGFLRKMLNKITQHQKFEKVNPNSRSMFGGGKSE